MNVSNSRNYPLSPPLKSLLLYKHNQVTPQLSIMGFKRLFSPSGSSFIICAIATVMSFKVSAGCQSNYSWTQTADNVVSFTNTSTGTTGNTMYYWSFGDGTFNSVENNSHTYNAAGTYYVCLHITDTNCSSYFCDSITVTGVVICTMTAGCYEYAHASCDTCADGIAHSYASGGTAPYTYTWDTDPVQTTSAATGLLPGSYTVCITDANGCTACCTTIIDTVSCNVTVGCYEYAHASCDTCADGIAHSYASGGTAPYTYAWDTDPVQTTSSATGLLPGTYTVCATDANGCSSCCTVVIDVAGCSMTVVCYEYLHASCDTCTDGAAHAYASGGTEPYSYTWDTDPVQTTSSAIGLSPGTYTVCVTDANGCYACCTTAIDVAGCNLTIGCYEYAHASCDTCTDGVAHSYASGGTAPYTYTWDTNPVQNTSAATGLTPGTYTVCVTDANGCTACCTVTINNGGQDCSAYFYLYADTAAVHTYFAVNVTTGALPIDYQWSWGDGTFDSGAFPSHTYSDAGFYTICLYIEDATGCVDSICKGYDLLKMDGANSIVTVNVIAELTTIPASEVLHSMFVFPNPVQGTAFIHYSITTATNVSINLYDVLGSHVYKVLDAEELAGEYNVSADTRKLESGMYVFKLQAGGQVATQKIAVIK